MLLLAPFGRCVAIKASDKRNPEAGSGLEIHISLVLNVLKLLLNQ